MKPFRLSFFSPRVILGIFAGVAISVLLISLIRNYVLATILGLIVAVMIARLEQPQEYLVFGFIMGSIVGIFLGARNYLSSAETQPGSVGLVINILGGLVLTGLICAVYGFLAGKFLMLYKKGQGPFF